MISVEKKDCTGCEACANICPNNCINMIEDCEGFVYPQVHYSKCVKCGLCIKVCPTKKRMLNYSKNEVPIAYAAINKDNDTRVKSSSGAFFPLLAKYVLNNDGVVFGAAFDDNFEVKHIATEDKYSVEKLYSSKYVQSRIGSCYKQVKMLLESGRWVLFSGTPCQVYALNTFLNYKKYEKLITVDFICHGVPSPKVWRKYISEYLGEIENINKINFRDKRNGWSDFCFSADFKNKKSSICEAANDNSYVKGFLHNLYLRPSCYECKFKSMNRLSDITIADFWGIRHIFSDFYDNKGCSLVAIHSDKGKMVLDCLKNELIYRETNIVKAVEHNSAMIKSAVKHEKRDEFFRRYEYESICKLTGELCKEKLKHRIKRKIKKLINNIKL